jgi:hypothetical protein
MYTGEPRTEEVLLEIMGSQRKTVLHPLKRQSHDICLLFLSDTFPWPLIHTLVDFCKRTVTPNLLRYLT